MPMGVFFSHHKKLEPKFLFWSLYSLLWILFITQSICYLPHTLFFFSEKEGFTYYFWTMSLSEIWMVDNLWTIYNLAMLGDVPSHTALQKKLYLLDEWLCQHHTWHLEQRVCDLSLVVVWVVEWLTVWALRFCWSSCCMSEVCKLKQLFRQSHYGSLLFQTAQSSYF